MNRSYLCQLVPALRRYPRSAALSLLLAAGLTACNDSITDPTAPATPEAAPQTSAASVQHAGGRPVPDQYIVVLKDDVPAADVAGLSRRLAAAHGATLRHPYTGLFKGFAVRLPAQAAAALARDPHVAVVAEDEEGEFEQQASLSFGTPQKTTPQYNAPWGLDRVDQRGLPLSGTFWYPPTTFTNPVNVYIIDSGIDVSHPDFGGRATAAYDVTPGGDGRDCVGHGTAVASIVGGGRFGVAKGVRLHAVKIHEDTCSNGTAVIRSFTSSDLLAGMEWVLKNHVKPAVVNLSVAVSPANHGSAPTFVGQLVNSAATKLVAAGVFVAAGAGNDNADACGVAPASALGVAAAAGSDESDAKASFSNYGACVDLYAPAVNVPQAALYNREASGSGTSYAAPHVAGVAALYKATYGDAPSQQILDWMISTATPNVIKSNAGSTPNRLLHTVTSRLDDPGVFDAAFYLQQYPDLKAAYGTNYGAAREHWLRAGLPIEGRRGSREFDVQFYLRQNADLQAAYGTDYVSLLDHWLRAGLPIEGRRGSREFDVKFYLQQYPDLMAAYGTNYAAALDHWIRGGLPAEGRRGAWEVNVQYYLRQNADLQAAFGTNYAARSITGFEADSQSRGGARQRSSMCGTIWRHTQIFGPLTARATTLRLSTTGSAPESSKGDGGPPHSY
jgi:subtilisin family serine protease